MSMGAIFSHMEEFNDTRLLFTRFHVIRHLVRLPPPLPSGLRQQNLWDIGGKVQPLLPDHLHPPLTSWTNIIKIGCISFGAPLVVHLKYLFFARVELQNCSPEQMGTPTWLPVGITIWRLIIG